MKKICVWNVNCATNKEITMPDFIGAELQEQNSEFIVLTEFCKTKNYKEFCQKYFDNDYNYIITNNSAKHNDILLAWKKDKYNIVKSNNNIFTNSITPNFAYVVLKDKTGFEFVLAGIRITIESYENRVKQLFFALDSLKSFSHVVLGGDFNCLRRKTSERKWNITVLSRISKQYGFNLFTPEGQSIYAYKAFCEAYEFAEDHFVVKGLEVKNEIYDRNFTIRNSNIYLYGKDFSVYDSTLGRNIWSIDVGSGVPDHAILSGNLYVNSEKEMGLII